VNRGAVFRDRRDAGRQLAEAVDLLALDHPIVLALPRGGVPVGHEVARHLGAPLEVFVVRKLGAPGQPEFGIGAIAEDGTSLVDDSSCRGLGVTRRQLDAITATERDELQRRVARYRGDRALPSVADRDVIVVDDGLATGVTARTALEALRRHHPRRLVLAVPVGAPETAAQVEDEGAEVVCLNRPSTFRSVGAWYQEFDQITDDEVLALLGRSPGG